MHALWCVKDFCLEVIIIRFSQILIHKDKNALCFFFCFVIIILFFVVVPCFLVTPLLHDRIHTGTIDNNAIQYIRNIKLCDK